MKARAYAGTIMGFGLAVICLAINGIFLSFKTHALTGVIAVLFPPFATVVGISNIFFGLDIPAALMGLLI